ncbi:uncharacterized protein EV154DRAFT_493227, partial [Mucor mucedo]|uniref:uncharacterized protein n=1 Tax=Mucor mucedo TaxID=29922 RepID=UPI002220FC8C
METMRGNPRYNALYLSFQHSCLLSLHWGEIPSMHHSSEDQDAARYVDGMAHERAVFEASFGQCHVNKYNVIDNGTKQINSMMSMLKDIAIPHVNSEFDTKVFDIQSAKSNIILSETLYKEKMVYIITRSPLCQSPYGIRRAETRRS